MKRFLGYALILVLLAGCGNKGPLYLPDKPQPTPPAHPTSGK